MDLVVWALAMGFPRTNVGNSPLFANVIELSQSKAIASAVGGKLVKHDTVATKGRTEKQIGPKKKAGEV